jgi:Spy/CpxP family protein refolding chaperone
MDIIRKNRFLLWALILLLVVNLSALASYFIFRGENTETQLSQEMTQPLNVFRSELGLTELQVHQVELINKEYRAASAPLASSIREIRGDILDELAADEPDTSKLNRYSDELARMQKNLQKESIHQYLELKMVCSPAQAIKLSNLYRELYRCPMQGQGQGMQHRFRHGRHGGGN